MEKLSNGVWYSKKNVDMKRYLASYENRKYYVLAVSPDNAREKIVDHFGNVNFQIQEL